MKELQLGKYMKMGMCAALSAAMLITGIPAASVSASVITDESTIPAGHAVLATKDYLASDGTGIDYNASKTYVVGYMQVGSGINTINGNYINMHFSREIKYKTKVPSADRNTEEYVEFIQNQTDTDDDGIYDSYCDMAFTTPRDDNKTIEYLTIGKFNRLDPGNALNLRVFIMCLHNLKSDVEITYDFLGEHVYQIEGATSASDTRPFVNGETLTANKTTIQIRDYNMKFDTQTTKPDDVTVGEIKDQAVPYNSKVTDPGAPTLGEDSGYRFAGWYTSAETQDDTTKWDFDEPLTEDITLYAKYEEAPVENKTVTLSFNDDSLYRHYPMNGKSGDQLNYTLTIGDKSYNTADPNLTDEGKALLDQVTFSYDNQWKFANITGRNQDGETYHVADVAKGGKALAAYSGVEKITLHYGDTINAEDNRAEIVVPGDVDGSGFINTGDLAIMASYIRQTVDVSTLGDYFLKLADFDGDGNVIMADISIGAAVVRDKAGYNNSFLLK